MSCFTDTTIGPYVGVENEHHCTFSVGREHRRFRVFTYRAYNAFGLIGPEMNGIAVLDEDRKHVLCDGIEQATSGYFGVSEAVAAKADWLATAPWEQFRQFINNHPRTRYQI